MKKIVVAENDEDILFILNMTLNEAGYEVQTVKDGRPLVSESSDLPDLYILDKEMPAIDGITVCKFVRMHETTKSIPIIMMSAYHRARCQAVAAGANEFFEKP